MKLFVRITLSALAVALCWFLAWLAGFDFDQRNPMVAYWGLISVLAGVFVFSIQ